MAALEYTNRMKYALVINRSSSKCGRCSLNADPNTKQHILPEGWQNEGSGCGVYWRWVTSEYSGMDDRLKEMRPDLELLEYLPFTAKAAADRQALEALNEMRQFVNDRLDLNGRQNYAARDAMDDYIAQLEALTQKEETHGA